jgi:hypothetical protein
VKKEAISIAIAFSARLVLTLSTTNDSVLGTPIELLLQPAVMIKTPTHQPSKNIAREDNHKRIA